MGLYPAANARRTQGQHPVTPKTMTPVPFDFSVASVNSVANLLLRGSFTRHVARGGQSLGAWNIGTVPIATLTALYLQMSAFFVGALTTAAAAG